MNATYGKRPTLCGASRPSVLFLPCYRDQRMLNGVCRFAFEAGWVLDTYYYHTGILPHAWSGDGIICMLQTPEIKSEITGFVRAHFRTPTVDLSLNEPSVALPRVLQDNLAIGRMGAAHLASIGCTQVGFVMQARNSFHQERYEGFRDQAQALGLRIKLIRLSNGSASGRYSHEWLEWIDDPI